LIARLLCALLLSVGLAAQSAPARPAASYRIAGTVVSSMTGEPLGAAKVSIVATEDEKFQRHVITPPDGRFAFADLPVGKYSLTASAHGYRAQGFNQHGDFFTGIAVGPDLDAGNLTFRLVPDAGIEGTVTEEDGEPVRNANVALFQCTNDTGQQRTQQVFGAVTDDRGHYQFSHRSPGTYFVAVSARPWYAQYQIEGQSPGDLADAAYVAQEKAQLDVAYPMTFYPSAEDSSGASAITPHPGERVTADVAVRAMPAVHLRIKYGDDKNSGASAGNRIPWVSQRIFDGALVQVMSVQGQTTTTGTYEYTGFAPGHYVIEMPDPGLKRNGGGWYKEMDLSGTVDLDARDARENPPLASVTGALMLEGATRPSGKVYVVLVNRTTGENFSAEVTAKGTFDFGDSEIRPSAYDVVLNNAPGFQVKGLLAKGARVAGKTLEISGGSVQVVCTATHAVARIDGVVQRDDKPFAGAMVVLVPRNPASNWTLFRRDQSDSDGTFSLREVLPGPYTVIALENAWDLDWASPAALQPFLKNGTPIGVGGESKLSVKVQVQ